MALELGFMHKRVPLDELLDRSFIPAKIEPAKIDLTRLAEFAPKESSKSAPVRIPVTPASERSK